MTLDPEIRDAVAQELTKRGALIRALKDEIKKTQLVLEQFEPTADRRERIATAAMQGILANYYCSPSCKPYKVVEDAVDIADALIAALDGE